MTERRRRRVDPVESEIETALQPGRFIPDRISFTFVSELEGVAGTIHPRREKNFGGRRTCY